MKLSANLNNYKEISPRLYGIFFEDINFSIDGGINNNQINNPRMDCFCYDFKRDFYWLYYQIFHARRRFMTRIHYTDHLRYWEKSGDGTLKLGTETPLAPLNPNYMDITIAKGKMVLKNLGYNGGDSTENGGRYLRRNSKKPGVGIKEGHDYTVSVFVNNRSFVGSLVCYVEDIEGNLITDKATITIESKKEWTKVSATVVGNKTQMGRFVVEIQGEGSLYLNNWYFGDNDHWGKGEAKWSGGKMRRDLVQALKDLNPKFVRFPGGCLVEGLSLDNSFDWTITVGDVEKRGAKYNCWGERQKDRSYMQTNEIGFYEYFLLSEDLGAEPLPILNAGLACQARCDEKVTEGDPEFDRRLNNILALIEYANGNPEESAWAKLRAEAGHPAPFNLKIIGIGNENWGEVYNKNFDIMRAAVKEKYPEIEVIWTVGFDCFGHEQYEERRAPFDGKWPEVIVDDHFYRSPEWCIEHANMYDSYPRERNRIFLGEYAANQTWDDKAMPNNYYSALSEGAYLTGLERNADIVVISSYAPLFSRVGGEQWKHNMINFNSLYTLKTLNYHVQEMYANNYGDKYLFVEEPEKDGIFTSVTANDEFVFIKVCNVNKEEREYEMEIKGAELEEKGTLTELYCNDDYHVNKITYYGKPEEEVLPIVSETAVNGGVKLTLKPRSVNVIKVKIK